MMGKTAQPYASLFMHDGNQIMGEACSEAYHAFKSECIRVAQGIDMPDDHLSFMFEFTGEAVRARKAVRGMPRTSLRQCV